MSGFFKFCGDEKVQSERFYGELTDDDIRYIEAAQRKDYLTCSAFLEKYFQMKMPHTRCRHKVWRRDNKKDIYIYKVNRKKKHDAGWLGNGIYFYGVEEEAWKAVEYGYWCQGFYINVEAPFTMDYDLHNALIHHNDSKVSTRTTELLEKNNYDGVFWAGDMREEWCAFTPEQVKRAEITRDDEGRIIPISRRFDLSNLDNRF